MLSSCLLRFLPMTLLLLGLLFFVSTTPTPASTVASHTYYVAPNGNDSNSGSSLAPFLTIQNGIDNTVNGDIVTVEDGTYTGPGNVDIDFVGKNITIMSQHGAPSTIIDCQGDDSNNHRGFYLHSGETSAVISGFTVENGYESAVASLAGGGGILDDGSGLTIQNCIIQRNTVIGLTSNYGFGGGIYAHNGSGPVQVTNCTVSGNTSSYGGGVFDFSSNSSGAISLTSCTITNNMALVACGGVYSVSDSQMDNTASPITLTQCTATGNLAIFGGGGIDNEADSKDSLITLNKCTASGNMGFYGAGIFNENDGGIIQLSDCVITNNAGQTGSGGGGGGVFDDSGSVHGTTTLTRCTIEANLNSYQQSGGLSNNGSITNLLNCDITGNSSLHNSGAVSNDNAGNLTLVDCTLTKDTSLSDSNFDNGHGTIFNAVASTLTLTNCTITGNMTTNGGDVYSTGGVTLLNNDILTGNLTTTGSEIVQSGGVVSVAYCDIQGGYSGTRNISTDPLFVSATDFHLQSSSPCIGAGNRSAPGYLPYTEDYQPRPNLPSIGAFEVEVARLAITTITASRSGGTVTVTAKIQNYGNAEADAVQITQAKLGTATANALPPGPYTIPAGGVQTISLTFTTTAKGRQPLRLQGTSSGASFSAGQFLAIP